MSQRSEHPVDFAAALRRDAAISPASLSAVLERERADLSRGDCLRRHPLDHEDQCEITPADRGKLVDWCYDLADQLRLDRETVAVAMNVADRFAGLEDRDVLQDRGQYQLVVVTSLYVAVKLHERTRTLGSRDFSAATQGTYSAEEIEDTETRVLDGLGWRPGAPTSLQVAHRILSVMLSELDGRGTSLGRGAWDLLLDEVAFGTESAVRDYPLAVLTRASTVAVASIINAVERAGDDRDFKLLTTSLLATLREFDFDPPDKLLAARDRLHRLIDGQEDMEADVESEDTGLSSPGSGASRSSSPRSALVFIGTRGDSCATVC